MIEPSSHRNLISYIIQKYFFAVSLVKHKGLTFYYRWAVFFLALIGLSLTSSCSKGKLDIALSEGVQKPEQAPTIAPAQVFNVDIDDNKLVVQGDYLHGVSSVQVTGPNGFDESFSIQEQSPSELIAHATSHVAFAIGSLFSLIISDAHGSTTYTITFTLEDGQVTANKLDDMGASDGDSLVYNSAAQTWEAMPLNGLNYRGTWDADNLGCNEPDSVPSSGDYWVVSNGGVCNLDGFDNWFEGDWAIYNTTAGWQQVVNTSDVVSFNGRQGAVTPEDNDYTWEMIDLTGSTLSDIADIDIAGLQDGQILKWDNILEVWYAADDEIGDSVSASDIEDGAISDIHINASADIAQSKIANLEDDLNDRLLLSGGTMTGALNMGSQNITNAGTINGESVTTMRSDIDSNTSALSGKEDALPGGGDSTHYLDGDKTWQTLNTSVVPESGGNEYFTEARVRDTVLTGYTPGADAALDQSDSLLIALGKLEGQIANAGSGDGDFLADGSVPMTDNFDGGGNNITNIVDALIDGKIRLKDSTNDNYVELQAPNAVTSTITFTLPGADGSTGQVLTTDGAGALSWEDAGSSDITEVAAGDALSGGGTTGTVTLNVDVDGTTINIGGSGLEVGTIGNAQLASDIDASKITAGTLPDARLSSDVSLFGSSIVNADVDATANIAWSKIDKTGASASDVGAAGSATEINSGAGLSGGGDLSTNRTLSVNVDDATLEINGSDQLQVKEIDASLITTGEIAEARLPASALEAGATPTSEIVSTDFTILSSDNLKVFLADTGATQAFLPAAADAGTSFSVTINRINPDDKLEIIPDGVETINGNELITLDEEFSTVTLISSGANWHITHQLGSIGTGLPDCPTGFIPVLGNATFGTDDFCVMKYEARDVSGTATSQAAGTPWVSISATDSKAECENLGSGYDLISNPEWMTIARDAESIGSNWSGGSPGAGEMARGWTAHTSYDDSWTNGGAAPNSEPSCLYNTASDTCGSTGDHKHRRTLALSTGEEIWDFSGNVWNWVDWEASGSFTTGPTGCTASWTEFPSVTEGCGTPSLNKANDLLPSDSSYDSGQSIGRFYGGSGGAARRGGRWVYGSRGGAFSMVLNLSPSDSSAFLGFRCVWRPN